MAFTIMGFLKSANLHGVRMLTENLNEYVMNIIVANGYYVLITRSTRPIFNKKYGIYRNCEDKSLLFADYLDYKNTHRISVETKAVTYPDFSALYSEIKASQNIVFAFSYLVEALRKEDEVFMYPFLVPHSGMVLLTNRCLGRYPFDQYVKRMSLANSVRNHYCYNRRAFWSYDSMRASFTYISEDEKTFTNIVLPRKLNVKDKLEDFLVGCETLDVGDDPVAFEESDFIVPSDRPVNTIDADLRKALKIVSKMTDIAFFEYMSCTNAGNYDVANQTLAVIMKSIGPVVLRSTLMNISAEIRDRVSSFSYEKDLDDREEVIVEEDFEKVELPPEKDEVDNDEFDKVETF